MSCEFHKNKFYVQTVLVPFVLSGYTNKEVKSETWCIAQRQFQYCFRGHCDRLAGIEMDSASDISVPHQRLQLEFSLTHPAASTPSCLILTTSGMCSFFLYLSTLSLTHAPTLLAYFPKFLPFIDDPVMHSLSLSVCLKALSLIITGSQSRVWFCLIRRQRQAPSWHRGYSCGGVRCAAKWTSQRTTIVSQLRLINLLQDLMRLHSLHEEHMTTCLHTCVNLPVRFVNPLTTGLMRLCPLCPAAIKTKLSWSMECPWTMSTLTTPFRPSSHVARLQT